MQVDKLFGTSKIVGKILNQYQIDYVMNLKKKTVKYYVMSSPHVISCVDIVVWSDVWSAWLFKKLLCFCPKALKTDRERIPVIQT